MIEVRETLQFSDWLSNLKDREARARIQGRILRLRVGNPGQRRALKGGVSELKIDTAPATGSITPSAARCW